MHSGTLCDTLNVIENVPFQKDHVVHTFKNTLCSLNNVQDAPFQKDYVVHTYRNTLCRLNNIQHVPLKSEQKNSLFFT